MGYGKWIFGSIGFALSGTPIGAVVGFALGSLLDNATDRVSRKGGDQAEQKATGRGHERVKR